MVAAKACTILQRAVEQRLKRISSEVWFIAERTAKFITHERLK